MSTVIGNRETAALLGADSRGRSATLLWLGAIILLGAGLRWYQLGTASLWHDELFTWYFQKLGLGFLWTEGLRLEPNPPLFYGLLSLWTPVVGTSEAGLRSLSAIAGVLAIPMVFLLGRELFADRRTALIGALLFALAPTTIYYSQEARGYMMVTLCVAVSLWGTARFLRAPGQWGGLACYVLGALPALYLHITVVLFVVSANLVVVAARLLPWRGLVRWVAANALLAVLAVPLLVLILSPTVAEDLGHLERLSLHEALFSVGQLLTSRTVPERFIGYGVAFVFSVALVAALLRRGIWPERRVFWLLVALPVTFLVIAAALSLRQQVLVGRVLTWMWVPLSLVLAHALLAGARRRALLAATVLLFAVGLFYHLEWPGWNADDWRSVMAQLEPDLRTADMVVIGPDTFAPGITYYAPDTRHLRHLEGQTWHTVSNTFVPDHMGIPNVTQGQVAAAVAAGSHVVLISRGEDLDVVKSLQAQTPPPRRAIDRYCGPELCFRLLVW